MLTKEVATQLNAMYIQHKNYMVPSRKNAKHNDMKNVYKK